ncbi:hypothetical protein MMC17_007417 [Xylographa soralifera]|nr:hypothetical protein [Xylographa soralifera]
MAFFTEASHDVTISSIETEPYGSFFNDAFSVEDPGAEVLFSPRYTKQDQESRHAQDHTIADVSHGGPVDIEEDCFLADMMTEDCQRVVEIPAMLNLNSTSNELSVRPSANMLRICVPSSEEHTKSILSNPNHRTDTRDYFQRPIQWFSDSLDDTVWTDGFVPNSAAPSYGPNCSLGSFATAGMNQVEDIKSCMPFEYQTCDAWPEVNRVEIQGDARSIDFVLNESLGIPPERELLVVEGITRSQDLNSDLILCPDSILTTNSQCYDIAFGGHSPNTFAGIDQYLLIEHLPSVSDPCHLFEGSFQRGATAAVSYVGSNSFEGPLMNAAERNQSSNKCFTLQPALVNSQYIPSTIGETIDDKQTTGTSHRKSLQTSNVGSFTAATSSIVDDRLWAILDPTASTTLDLGREKTQQRMKHRPGYSSHERTPARIAQKDTDMTATTLHNNPETLRMASENSCKRHKNTLAMYDAMVTGYSNVCRGASSPFQAGWRVEDHTDAFGSDAGLMADFKAIMELERQWREDCMDEDDVVFRKLVVERKERIRKPQRK